MVFYDIVSIFVVGLGIDLANRQWLLLDNIFFYLALFWQNKFKAPTYNVQYAKIVCYMHMYIKNCNQQVIFQILKTKQTPTIFPQRLEGVRRKKHYKSCQTINNITRQGQINRLSICPQLLLCKPLAGYRNLSLRQITFTVTSTTPQESTWCGNIAKRHLNKQTPEEVVFFFFFVLKYTGLFSTYIRNIKTIRKFLNYLL